VVLSGCSAIVIGTLIFCARTQVSYWQNSELLWTHTLACTSGNFIAQNDLGNALLQEGDADGAMIHFQTAVQINPDYVEALNNVGSVLAQQGKLDEAIIYFQKVLQINPDSAGVQINLGKALLIKGRADEAMVHFQAALQSKPDSVEAHISLGNILLQQGRTDEAIAHYEKVLQINPDSAPVHFNLGNALLRKGRMEEAIGHFQAALQLKPNSAEAHISLGNVLLQMDRTDEAMVHYQKALDIKPDSPMVLNNLAWLLATSPDAHIRDGVLAVKYAERACELTHYGAAPLVGTLAAAYAEAGRYDDAVAAAQKACALATAEGKQGLLETTRNLLQLYLVHQPYHEADGRSVPAGP
jgi:Tfp pilus assembly protein PilF